MVSATHSSSPFLLFKCRVRPAGYHPCYPAPVWALLHKLHAVPAPSGTPLQGLQPPSGNIHLLCCSIFRLPDGDLLCHGPPWAARGQPASPWFSLWAAEESLLRHLEHQAFLSAGLFLSHFSHSPLSELLYSGTLLGGSEKNSFTQQDRLCCRQLPAQTTLPGGSLHATFLSHVLLKKCLPD